jgi:hypothetical protein
MLDVVSRKMELSNMSSVGMKCGYEVVKVVGRTYQIYGIVSI